MIGAPRDWSGAAAGERGMVGDEERSRKPRVTLERKMAWECNSRGDEGLYSWQSGEGARYPIRWDARGFGSDEMPLLYENRCLAVGLVQIRFRQSPAEC
jgi:hypothetical protein